jgi:hypothetical protein
MYRGPKTSTMESSEPSAATKSQLLSRRSFRKALASKGKELESPSPSSDNEGCTELPSKKTRVTSSVSVIHVQPLRCDDDADDHNLLLLTLTGGHGVFMAQALPCHANDE